MAVLEHQGWLVDIPNEVSYRMLVGSYVDYPFARVLEQHLSYRSSGLDLRLVEKEVAKTERPRGAVS